MSAYSQSQLEKDLSGHYQKFDINKINSIHQNLDTNLEKNLMDLQNMLNDFYKNHPSKAMEPDDIDLEVTLKKQDDPNYQNNVRRKSMIRNLKQKQNPKFISEAPNIFELHYSMAEALIKAQKKGAILYKSPFKASYYFLEALGYRTLKLSVDIWTNPGRLVLLKNDQETKDAENFKQVQEALESARKNYEDTKRKLFVQEDNAVPDLKDPGNNNPAYVNNKVVLEDLLLKVQGFEKDMIHEMEIYHEYEIKYNKKSADFLLEFAANVKSIEKNIRDHEKILNSVEYYRGNYDGTFHQSWKLESREMAYVGLLEMASLLDTRNAKTPAILGNLYNTAGDNQLAISSFERSLRIQEDNLKKLPDEDLLSIYKNLGDLYYETNRYIDSAWYYEKAYAVDKNPDTEFQLAKIHAERTGNYKRASDLFNDLYAKVKAPASTTPVTPEIIRYKFQLLSFLVTILEKTGPQEKLMDQLKQVIQIHSQLEEMILNNYDSLRTSQKNMIDARVELNRNPGQTTLQNFYQAQQGYNDQKEAVQKLESTRKSLNLQKIYFSLAYQNELQNDLPGAINVYRRAESYGIDPDRSRIEIMRLQKIYMEK